MKIKWLRLSEDIDFNNNTIWFVVGARNTGKSTLLEHLGLQYLQNGYSIFDLFGSRDGEGLAWLRAPEAEDKKILLLKNENTFLKFKREKQNVDFLNWKEFNVKVLEDYDIVISASLLYNSVEEEFHAVNFYIDQIYRNPVRSRKTFLIIREAANLLYARMKLNQNIQSSKGEMAYLVRESRHCNLSLGFDTQKRESVDAEIRSVVDYFLFTAQGSESLPKPLWFLYKYIKPPSLNTLPKGSFAILSRRGAIGIGAFAYHNWHKDDKENITAELGLEIQRPEAAPLEEKPKIQILEPTNSTDEEKEKVHAEVCRLFAEGENLTQIALRFGKTYNNWSKRVIISHNKAVSRNGFCAACRKYNNGLDQTILKFKSEVQLEKALAKMKASSSPHDQQ
ncbi:MAG: hypothetical protein ACPLZY_04260, partial [Candidatus Norongarragalinales archaeon]